MIDEKQCFDCFDKIAIPMVFYFMDNSIKYINTAFESMTGYRKEDIISLKPPYPWMINDDTVDNSIFLKLERLYKKANGDKIWVELSRSESRDKNGNDIIIENWFDISKRKSKEESLQSYQDQLRVLDSHLEFIKETERKKIAKEVHDELGQIMTVLKMDIYWILKRIPQENEELIEKTRSTISLIDSAIKSIQRISTELRPRILDDFGLVEAINYQIKQFIELSNINCEIIRMPENINLDQESSIAFYRILQEIMTNIIRHSNANKVTIDFEIRKKRLYMAIKDNGKGISQGVLKDPKSLGIIGIKERVKYLNGRFKIESGSGGTEVNIDIPLKDF
jgi:PAS domain S-box-containing protein